METGKLVNRRLLKYWCKNTQEYLGILLLMVAGFSLLRYMFRYASRPEDVLDNLPMFTIYLGMFFSVIISLTDMRNGTTISMVFGGTRKEAFLGQQISALMRLVEIMILYAIFEFASVKILGLYSFHLKEMVLYIGIFLGITGIVQFVGAIAIRFGGKIMIAVYALCGAAGGAIGGGAFAQLEDGMGHIRISGNFVIPLVFVGTGAVIYFIGAAVNHHNIRKFTVG